MVKQTIMISLYNMAIINYLLYFRCLIACGSRMDPPPKMSQTLIPEMYEYVTLHGQRDGADVIKVQDLKIRRSSWIF